MWNRRYDGLIRLFFLVISEEIYRQIHSPEIFNYRHSSFACGTALRCNIQPPTATGAALASLNIVLIQFRLHELKSIILIVEDSSVAGRQKKTTSEHFFMFSPLSDHFTLLFGEVFFSLAASLRTRKNKRWKKYANERKIYKNSN